MTERKNDQVRQAAKEALLAGKPGEEIALLFRAAGVALEQAETEMQALGFFALAVTDAEVAKLYVSRGISQPGIVTLLQSFQYSKLPSVIWNSTSHSESDDRHVEDMDLPQSSTPDPASSGAVRRGKF